MRIPSRALILLMSSFLSSASRSNSSLSVTAVIGNSDQASVLAATATATARSMSGMASEVESSKRWVLDLADFLQCNTEIKFKFRPIFCCRSGVCVACRRFALAWSSLSTHSLSYASSSLPFPSRQQLHAASIKQYI
jgi:hypothetical protein